MSNPVMAADNIIAREKVATTCCYCGVGCGVDAEVEQVANEPSKVVAVAGSQSHPANLGRLCVKGSSLHETQSSPDRLLQPMLYGNPVDWDTALDTSADKFRQIIAEHGPDAVAFYLSGQLLTEDYYVANKLMKGFIGTSNIDTNSRLCMASAVVAHKRAFGSDAVPACYEDLEQTDLLFIVGSNAAYAHPVLFQRIAKAREERPEMQVVVIDPRRTATCDIADIHLPLRPGSDAFFFNGLLAYLARNNKLDQSFIDAHTNGFDTALAQASEQCPDTADVAKACDIPEADVESAYKLFAQQEKVITFFSQGINQSSSGVDKGNAIINCHLATGKIGKPGSAPFSITGQPNAMGGREVGGLANQLAAHMGFDKPEDIERVKTFWDAPNMAQSNGLKAVDMFRAIEEGKIKAVWIMATNPAVTLPEAGRVRRALEQCDWVMVSDCIGNTDTAKLAHAVLPATTWSEKHGTVTNSERCISLQKGFLPAPGEARHDWQIICQFAAKLGFGKDFDYTHQADIFREHAALSALDNDHARAFNISAMQDITNNDYENLKPIRWPVTATAGEGTDRLFSDGRFYTPDQRANFVAIDARLPVHAASLDQVVLNTGRVRDQWHTMSRTGTASKLLAHVDEPYIDIHPKDIEQFHLIPGDLAVLANGSAKYFGRVQATESQRRGEVFVPMHWNNKYAVSSCADDLVNPEVDPLSGQPEFKHTPVRLKPFRQAWNGFLLSTEDIQPKAEYWAKITLDQGYKFRLADGTKPDDWLAWVSGQFPDVSDWVRVQDSNDQFFRAAGFIDGVLKVVFSAATDKTSAREMRWLDSQLNTKIDANTRFAILAGVPGAGVEDVGNIICSCFQVGENTIKKAIAGGCTDAESLGEKLKCGTNCGSCIPELKALFK
ncbi:molybdopterin-dependent oxidoreductase [Gilvimarinus sp. SDUM040013]|uniref:Molybdopterin-dependent oxidoreductase n=1 Tax=Gilvimarinus gilvus TaxID=3058038 RepID=A0ABU4RS55_9GAMM|nr:nitrate reductase [Gilvimarinus sp. SDUM040013]MDO3388167.1 molybdopterin-dependent oxidoreductase [Gilvimarinus sp. SDUM040013]MDX6847717.1 molybdopterin-dependent oxidoreductase [Gilvimarinus sp. SDUM040013]